MAGRPPLHPSGQRGLPGRGEASESDLSEIKEEADSDFEGAGASGGSVDYDDDEFSDDSSSRWLLSQAD